MKKSVFIKLALVLSLGLSGLANAADDTVYRWKMAETWGPNFPIFGDATKNLAKTVKEMSNGRLLIRVDSSNKHKSPLGIFDFVKSGQYQKCELDARVTSYFLAREHVPLIQW